MWTFLRTSSNVNNPFSLMNWWDSDKHWRQDQGLFFVSTIWWCKLSTITPFWRAIIMSNQILFLGPLCYFRGFLCGDRAQIFRGIMCNDILQSNIRFSYPFGQNTKAIWWWRWRTWAHATKSCIMVTMLKKK